MTRGLGMRLRLAWRDPDALRDERSRCTTGHAPNCCHCVFGIGRTMCATRHMLTLLLLLASATTPPVATTAIEARSGRSCNAFFFAGAAARDVPIAVYLTGTGEYSNSRISSVNPIFGELFGSNEVAVLTIDKPGISVDGKASRGFTIADDVYNKYTLDDLTDCVVQGLVWATQQPQAAPAGKIVIMGHSEGSLVAVRVVARLQQQQQPGLASRLSALVLSSVPAAPMTTVVKRQAGANWPRYKAALKASDDAFFRSRSGIGAATMQSLLDAEPLALTFTALANLGIQTRIAIFQCRNDTATPVADVEKLATINGARIEANERMIELSVRTYPGCGHSLGIDAVVDMGVWLQDALAADGYLSTAPRRIAPPAPVPASP